MDKIKKIWKDWWVGLFFIFMLLSLTAGITGMVMTSKSTQGKWLEEHNKLLKRQKRSFKVLLDRILELKEQLKSKTDWYENKIKEDKIVFELIKKTQPKDEELH